MAILPAEDGRNSQHPSVTSCFMALGEVRLTGGMRRGGPRCFRKLTIQGAFFQSFPCRLPDFLRRAQVAEEQEEEQRIDSLEQGSNLERHRDGHVIEKIASKSRAKR